MKLFYIILLLSMVSLFYSPDMGFSQMREDISNSNPKINPIISEWQSSEDPETFASENNLSFFEGKLSVYVHLNQADSISRFPKNIDIQASDNRIVVAFVTSNQIDDLATLDFVIKITPPDYVKTLPSPKIQPEESVIPIQDENIYLNLIWIIILGSIIVIVIILKKQKKHTELEKN